MYALRISGQPVRRTQYTRVPHIDTLGLPVTAYVHETYTNYRVNKGSLDERRMRAELIKSAFGGTLINRTLLDFVVQVPFV